MGGIVQKHRIIITSAAIFILLSCLPSRSEGRSFCPLDRIAGGTSYNKWRADDQHPVTDLLYCNVQDKEGGDNTLICSCLPHFVFFAEISYIREERYVFSSWNQYPRTLQRPPPLIEI